MSRQIPDTCVERAWTSGIVARDVTLQVDRTTGNHELDL